MEESRNRLDGMAKVYIWGAGVYGKSALQVVKTENCVVEGFIDNNPVKWGQVYENKTITSFKKVANDYDYIIISVAKYEAILYQLEKEGNVDFSKIIVFFDEAYSDKSEYTSVIDLQKWKIFLLEQKVRKLEKIINIKCDNLGYEIIEKYNKNMYRYPLLATAEEAVNKIVNERCSLVRYGDGEFEFMAGNERLVYQKYDSDIAKRLLEIISCREEKLLIGIANNYGALDMYTEDTANGIRFYMDEKTRRFHMSVLESDRIYYDAYMFKCYFPYKNREDTWKRVELIKRIWAERDIVIIEGDKTRTGYGNDLFDNAKSLHRILTPTINAYAKYGEILDAALRVDRNCLILVVLGPTANLLVYDLMKMGYQAVDIGQIDMDYEWYKMGAEKRIPIRDRYVSQLPPTEIEEINDIEYLKQIVERING